MSSGLDINSEDIKKLAGALKRTVAELGITGNALSGLASEAPKYFKGEAAVRIASALSEYNAVWAKVSEEENRIMEQLSATGISFASADDESAGTFQTGSLNL
ncbi:hypothetical protein FZI91_14805 [Mycobacterium sp. CBMA271]|uniref:hypothetical protein n=1 Tax=unclassified Mycobacteroides TaxID=2618759 RepID=UPI0012DCFA65|nr:MULTISPECIES: hypothetical protein [unclassified Mycobacteroides]MUM17759.1 hypothetical protein [Mycobacteroides sp. CBMA 326]MUM22966.1 hypothetical protein [Mycobacteroides sp. CBMA 271]